MGWKHLTAWSIAAATALAGCSPISVDAQDEAIVREYFHQDGHPTEVAKLWYVGDRDNPLMCGRMAPTPDGTAHRFFYDRHSKHGQTEWSDDTITTTASAQMILVQNKALFNGLWTDYCAPAEPYF